MKLNLISLIVFLFFSQQVFSQVFEIGDKAINPYFGFYGLNLIKPLNSETYDYKNAVSGGLRGQAIIGSFENAVYGFGLDLGYSGDSFEWTEQTQNQDPFAADPYIYTDHVWKRKMFYAGVLVDVHFLRYYDKLDFSISAMLGGAKVKNEETPVVQYPPTRNGFTLVYNWHVGVNYFLTDQIGLSLRLGMGTQGLGQLGVSFKL